MIWEAIIIGIQLGRIADAMHSFAQAAKSVNSQLYHARKDAERQDWKSQ